VKNKDTTVVKYKTFRLSSGDLTNEQAGINLTFVVCYCQRWSSEIRYLSCTNISTADIMVIALPDK